MAKLNDENGDLSLDEAGKAIDNATEDNIFTLSFKTPFEYQGEKYDALHFDFDKITGADLLNAEDELNRNNRFLLDAQFSGRYMAIVAAKACKEPLGSDFVSRLPGRKWNQLRRAVRNFFGGRD